MVVDRVLCGRNRCESTDYLKGRLDPVLAPQILRYGNNTLSVDLSGI